MLKCSFLLLFLLFRQQLLGFKKLQFRGLLVNQGRSGPPKKPNLQKKQTQTVSIMLEPSHASVRVVMRDTAMITCGQWRRKARHQRNTEKTR